MILSNYQFLLDVHEINSQVLLSFKEGDTGRVLHITLTEDGDIFDIPDGCVAVFTALKPDGKIVFNDCVIDGNEITYTVTGQSTAITGKHDCELRLYGAGNTILTSPRFTIIVHPAAYADRIESTDEYNALNNLIYEASSKLQNGDFIPKLSVGQVITLSPGSMATAEITGTVEEPVLNFAIPQGAEGQAEATVPDSALSETSTKPVQNVVITRALKNLMEALSSHEENTENPHSVTAEHVGLGRVNNTSDDEKPISTAQQAALNALDNAKVDKMAGKGLSANDFTDDYKNKLDGIEAGANKFSLGAGSVSTSHLADGAVTGDKVADEIKTEYIPVYILNNWSGDAAPYTHTATVPGLLENDKPKVFFTPPDNFENLEAAEEAFGLLYDVDSADGTVTFYAKEIPDVEFSVTLEVSRV